MYIGIDLGTSGVKAILLNEQGDVLATHTEKLTVSRPHPLWSEQEPEQWWQATDRAVKGFRSATVVKWRPGVGHRRTNAWRDIT